MIDATEPLPAVSATFFGDAHQLSRPLAVQFTKDVNVIEESLPHLFGEYRLLQPGETTLFESPKRRGQVPAIHSRDEKGIHWLERPRVIPIEKVSAVFRELRDG